MVDPQSTERAVPHARFALKSVLPLTALACAGALLAGCETVPAGDFGGPPAASAFRADDFAWSTRQGRASIEGRIDYRRDGQQDACGAVILTPDTPSTRARFRTLYGSTDRAQLPEAVVRSRTVADPNAHYRSFVQQET